MKAITLHEPWATMMATGAKTNETRGVRTNLRGDVAIHAGLSRKGASDAVCEAAFEAFKKRGVPPVMSFGCIVAVVEIYDVQPAGRFRVDAEFDDGFIDMSFEESLFGDYGTGRWIYRTRNLRRLKVPVAAKGQQCIGWELSPEIEAQVRRQL